jgi:hypothetical protein
MSFDLCRRSAARHRFAGSHSLLATNLNVGIMSVGLPTLALAGRIEMNISNSYSCECLCVTYLCTVCGGCYLGTETDYRQSCSTGNGVAPGTDDDAFDNLVE